jgi:hypothetical protein
VRQISTLQVKKYCIKGCPLYAIQVLNYVEENKPSLEDHPILREHKDVFPEEVSGLPPRRDIDFSIELVPGAVSLYREPSRMITLELVKLKLQLKEILEKGYFFQKQLHYLGHVISEEGVAVDPENIKSIMDWPTTKYVVDIRSFMGLAGYYRRFIKGFSKIGYPITSLQEKGVKFIWTIECEETFQQLKHLLTNASVLKIADPNKDLLMYTDACKEGLGGVLMQEGYVIC